MNEVNQPASLSRSDAYSTVNFLDILCLEEPNSQVTRKGIIRYLRKAADDADISHPRIEVPLLVARKAKSELEYYDQFHIDSEDIHMKLNVAGCIEVLRDSINAAEIAYESSQEN